MPDHRPITTVLAGDNNTASVHFHCPCGVNRRETIVVGVSPIERFTAAIRRLHISGRWPADDIDSDDAADAGWGRAPVEAAP